MHGAANPGASTTEPFTAGFRWSATHLSFSIHLDLTTAFGVNGASAVQNAFRTWDAAFGDTGPVNTRMNRPGACGCVDIESVALHEIGHALGLQHPDTAFGFGRNFNPAGMSVAELGTPVMHSTIGIDDVQRALARDDFQGFNYLYDPATQFNTLNATSTNLEVTGGGPGDLTFDQIGGAARGGLVGANIDILTGDLGGPDAMGRAISAQTFIYGGRRNGGDLAFDLARAIPVAGGAPVPPGTIPVGGFFDGNPNDLHLFRLDNANHDRNLISIDIIFNTNAAARMSVPLGVVPVPEPSTFTLLSIGALGLLVCAWRRRKRGA